MARNRRGQKNTTWGHTLTCVFFQKFWRLNSGAFFQQGLKLVRGCFFRGWARRGLFGRKHWKNWHLGSKQGLQKIGPERDGGKKLTSGPRKPRAVDCVSETKRPKMGSLVNFGCGPLRGLFYFELSEKYSKHRGEMESLEKLQWCEAQARLTH